MVYLFVFLLKCRASLPEGTLANWVTNGTIILSETEEPKFGEETFFFFCFVFHLTA